MGIYDICPCTASAIAVKCMVCLHVLMVAMKSTYACMMHMCVHGLLNSVVCVHMHCSLSMWILICSFLM
jgi:hypothetical protein